MILQTDPRFDSTYNGRIRYHAWGCYMMVLFWFVVLKKKYPLDVILIEKLTQVFELGGYIKSDLYVNNPDKILHHFGINVVTRKENVSYICRTGEVETLVFKAFNYRKNKYWYHRVAGNGHGIVTYDPIGYSRAVAEGALISKRIHKEF